MSDILADRKVTGEDTGHGIGQEELGTLFEAFVQTQSGIKSKEGTGLGLAIAKKAVDEHDGSIRVESKPGAGTTFTVEIPIAGGSDK